MQELHCFPAVSPHVAGMPVQFIILAGFVSYLHRLKLSDQILSIHETHLSPSLPCVSWFQGLDTKFGSSFLC